MPLYWGFWRLGKEYVTGRGHERNALFNDYQFANRGNGSSIVLEVEGKTDRLSPSGSNFSNDGLAELLGDAKVQFRESCPTMCE